MNNKKTIAEKTLIAFSAIILVCCSYNKNTPKSGFLGIKQFKLLLSFPTLTTDNRFITIKDSQYIIFYKDLALYKFPYTKEYSSNIFDSAGEIIEHKIIRTDTNFHYLIYRKGEVYGYAFDSTQDLMGRRLPVDSFLSKRFMINENFLYSPNDSLIKKTPGPHNTIHETYIRTLKKDKWDCDTNNLFFSMELKNIDFSFSKELDNKKKGKLIKVHQISNGDLHNNDFFFRQKREVIMEIKEIPIESSKEIIEFWNRHHEK